MLFDNGNSDGRGRLGEFKIYILVFFSRCSDIRNALLRIVSPKNDLRRDFDIFESYLLLVFVKRKTSNFAVFRFLKIVDFPVISELVKTTKRGYGSAYLRESRISKFSSVEISHLSKSQDASHLFLPPLFLYTSRASSFAHSIFYFLKFRHTRKYLVPFKS